MQTHRFGSKIKLPATIAIKHQLMKLMYDDSVKEAALIARNKEIGQSGEQLQTVGINVRPVARS